MSGGAWKLPPLRRPYGFAGIPPQPVTRVEMYYLSREYFPHWYDPETRALRPYSQRDSFTPKLKQQDWIIPLRKEPP